MQVGLRGCTSVIGKTMNYDTYRSIEVLTVLSPIGTGFTAYAPTIAAGTGVESSTGDTTLLKTAGNYAILGGQSIVGSAGAGSVIQGGNIGISPNNATSVTNFPPSVLLAPGIFDYADAASLQAQTDLTAALVAYEALVYTNLGSAVNMSVSGNGSTAATYLPGNYKSTSSLDIPTTITLDAQGNAGAIFRILRNRFHYYVGERRKRSVSKWREKPKTFTGLLVVLSRQSGTASCPIW